MTSQVDTARIILAKLIRHGDLPFSHMSTEDRRRLVESGYAVEHLRFDGYLSIHPRYVNFDAADASLVPAAA